MTQKRSVWEIIQPEYSEDGKLQSVGYLFCDGDPIAALSWTVAPIRWHDGTEVPVNQWNVVQPNGAEYLKELLKAHKDK